MCKVKNLKNLRYKTEKKKAQSCLGNNYPIFISYLSLTLRFSHVFRGHRKRPVT